MSGGAFVTERIDQFPNGLSLGIDGPLRRTPPTVALPKVGEPSLSVRSPEVATQCRPDLFIGGGWIEVEECLDVSAFHDRGVNADRALVVHAPVR